jgi:NAD(P)-dependent dehydrogenase (short-subunit alcohol dehydrogenase family)
MDKFLDNNKQDWAYAFNVNFYGTLNLVYETLNGMIKNGWGRIIHLSGGGAAQPLFGMTSYSASKSAAVRFIETLSLEYKDSGVTFNSIAPGILKTQLLDQMLQAGPSRIGNNLFTRALEIAGKQSDSTNKVLELIDFLTSDRGQGITGKLISAQWDAWQNWHYHIDELQKSDSFTLRRIVGKDRNMHWGDA